MSLTSTPGAATNNHQPAAASEVHTSVTGTSNRLPPPPSFVPIGTSGQEVHADAIPIAPAITERGSEPGGRGNQLQGPSVHPPPHPKILSVAYTGNTSANSSSSTGSMSGDGSSSSVVQRPSSSTVAKAPMRAVSSLQPLRSLQTIHPAKRPRQEDSDNNPDDRGCSTSSSAVVPLKRPASPAHLNEGRAHGAPSAKAPRTEGIAASHRESNGFPPSSYVTPPVVERRVPHHPKGQLAAFVPKAPRDLGKDPLVEKYRSLRIRPIAKVMRNKRFLLLPVRIRPLFCRVARPLEDKGERWTLKVLVADEYTAAPVFMVVGHELIMREYKFSVAECKVFRETNDSEKIKECERNLSRLRKFLAQSYNVLEVELSCWDPLPLIVNATPIDELLGTA